VKVSSFIFMVTGASAPLLNLALGFPHPVVSPWHAVEAYGIIMEVKE
jgi:hypothetical protein